MIACRMLVTTILISPLIVQATDHDAAWLTPGFLSFIDGSDASYTAILLNETKDCVDEIQKSSPIAAQRFTDPQLAILCRNRQKWTSQALERGVWSDPSRILTRKQQLYLEHFSTCQDLTTCICKNNKNCHTIDPHEPIDPLEPLPTAVPLQRPTPGAQFWNSGQERKKREDRSPGSLPKALRKEYRRLSDEERNRFHAAVNRLKADTVDNLSKYDLLVLYHTPQQAPGAHWGPAFLPWHRELLKQLEVALRTYDRTVALPYWDSTLDEGLPDPRDSVLWTDEFLGNGVGGVVNSGPFRNWTTYHAFANKRRIARNVGESPFGGLYRQSDLDAVMEKASFANLTNCVDPFFELLHGTVHLWVGGHMLDIPISPNDPSFFLHHSFVDWIWETFRQKRQTTKFQRETEYPPESQSCTNFHYWNTTMAPFPLRNSDGLSSRYTDIFYSFEDRPTCTSAATSVGNQCGSPYLVCDRVRWRCLSKVRSGGNCTGFENSEEQLCHNSTCVNGKCQPLDQSTDQQKVREFVSTSSIGEAANASVTAPAQGTVSVTKTAVTATVAPTDSGSPTDRSASCKPCECACPPSTLAISTTPISSETTATSDEPPDFLINGPSSKPITPSNFDELGDEYVWFTVTVLKGKLGDPIKEKVQDARVIVNGLNYNGTYEGRVSDRSDYPYYTGVSFIRVPNPRYQPGLRTEAQIEVYGSTTKDSSRLRRCQLHCRFDNMPCTGKVIFDLNRNDSSSGSMTSVIPYSTSPSVVLYQLWKNGEHQTDYFLFLCNDDSESNPIREDFIPKPTSSATNCVFQRFENFLLIGYAEHISRNISLAECKTRCRNGAGESAKNEDGGSDRLNCGSIMHWEKEGLCVMTSQSRLTKPALFAYFPKESAFYFDYICDAAEIFEG